MKIIKDKKSGITMRYAESIDEIIEIFSRLGQEPVYTSIGNDENGAEIAVPMFTAK